MSSALSKRVNKRKLMDEGDSDKEKKTEDEYASEESAETDLDEDVNESSPDQICEYAVPRGSIPYEIIQKKTFDTLTFQNLFIFTSLAVHIKKIITAKILKF